MKGSINSQQLKLPRLISDGMVLQRGINIKIWGWANPAEVISVYFINQEYSTTAKLNGKWMVTFPPLEAGGPYKMVVKGKDSEIMIKDILIGDVWVCSGQSNMELTMERVRDLYKKEISQSENNEIRQFRVPLKYDFNRPQQDLEAGNWKSANPESVLDFSATAYFFARTLYDKYQVPIGLINASVGGSPVEAWLSEDVLKDYPEHMKTVEKFKDNEYVNKIIREDEANINRWYENLKNKDRGLSNDLPWYDPAFDASDWLSMEIPASFNREGLKDFKGVIWFRKEIDLPASLAGKQARLWMERIVDSDIAYVNGKKVGKTEYKYPPRKYEIPEKLLKEGENTITIRVVCNNGEGEFVEDKPYRLVIGEKTIGLKGEWQYRVGAEVDEPLPEMTFVEWTPLGLFNGMISPLLNYGIKGVIWYQGESNISRPLEYQELFPTLIRDWRQKWGQGEFPFLYVQLPNYGKPKEQPSESEWAELREAQLVALNLPNTAMTVNIDVGEWNDLHPLNKKDVGIRLALAAQNKAYGDEEVVYSGPIYKSMKIKGNKAVISFTNAGGGLMAKGDKLKGFAIAGLDKDFIWAEARINGNQVIVWNDQVKNPVAVRYAWADNPADANLYNKEGLPARPFRTERK